MENKKILTLNDLYTFCSSKNFTYFNYKDTEEVICVQVPANFALDNISDKNLEGLIPFSAKAYHDNVNLNKSFISTESLENTLPSATLRPILAHVVEKEDGTFDFGSHDFEIEERDGEEKVRYLERPIGVIYGENSIEFDEKAGVNRAILHGFLYEDYSNREIEILERRKTTACSVELRIREMSYDANQKILNLDDFFVGGLTLLGEDVSPGMAGSELALDNFNLKNNSLFSTSEESTTELIALLQSLQDTLVRFEDKTKDSRKGGIKEMKLKELLEKYSKTEEDLDFDYSVLSDDELENKFKELFEDEDSTAEPDGDSEGEIEGDNPEVTSFKRKIYSKKDTGDLEITFEISHEDIRSALYTLLMTVEENDDEWYMINKVFDDYLIYSNWDETKIFRQSYIVDGDNVSLADERTELFKEYLTMSEKAALDEMRSNYAVLQNKVKEFESEKDKAEKDAIFADESYEILSEDESFNELKKNSAAFSIEEIRTKADLIFAALVKKNGQYSKKEEDKPSQITLNFGSTESKEYRPYGTLFEEKDNK